MYMYKNIHVLTPQRITFHFEDFSHHSKSNLTYWTKVCAMVTRSLFLQSLASDQPTEQALHSSLFN